MVNHVRTPRLERLSSEPPHNFLTPSKQINDGEDLSFFHSSLAYRDLVTWLLQLNRSMFPDKEPSGTIRQHRLDSPPLFSATVQSLRDLISDLDTLIGKTPPDTGPRRFGNVAFRTWFQLVEEGCNDLMQRHIGAVLERFKDSGHAVAEEVKVYLLGGFGSAQRLDYGTGHELSFMAFLGCLWKLGAFEDGEERAIVVGVVQPYLTLIRRLVLTYTLEPAGSHGVWGLDDHSFVPYIFGSAQYGPAIDRSASPSQATPTEGSLPRSPSPSKVAEKASVEYYKDSNMYFSAIQFIFDVKRGPFWEHSPVLYDISGIKDGWGKINKGMLKMYAAEVLGKFPVVQHFPFGSLFKWERDPAAVMGGASFHASQQPKATNVASKASHGAAVGTKAPWSKNSAGGSGSMPAATGIPSMRSPWPSTRSPISQAPASNVTPALGVSTAAPWAATQRPSANIPGGPDTRAAASKVSKPNDVADVPSSLPHRDRG